MILIRWCGSCSPLAWNSVDPGLSRSIVVGSLQLWFGCRHLVVVTWPGFQIFGGHSWPWPWGLAEEKTDIPDSSGPHFLSLLWGDWTGSHLLFVDACCFPGHLPFTSLVHLLKDNNFNHPQLRSGAAQKTGAIASCFYSELYYVRLVITGFYSVTPILQMRGLRPERLHSDHPQSLYSVLSWASVPSPPLSPLTCVPAEIQEC